MSDFADTIASKIRDFMQQDMLRRTGQAGDQRSAALEDRRREGALMASLLGPAAPLATLPVAAAGAGYEGVKALGQVTGLGKHLPGPFRTDASSSPADIENIVALLRGYTGSE
jgi:hypothetical protein